MAKGKGRSRRATKRTKSRRDRSAAHPLKSIGGLAVLCALVWFGYAGFQDRTYTAFTEAGDGAYERRHYAYAARMYREALTEAERIDPGGPKVAASLIDLSRTFKALGQVDLATAYLERTRTIRAQRQ